MELEENVKKKVNVILNSARSLRGYCDFDVLSDFIIVLLLFKYLSESFGSYDGLIRHINFTSGYDLETDAENINDIASGNNRWNAILSPQYFSFSLLSDEVFF
ncbi:hypothetical protein [Citrobacter sp. Igbk 17]|uniref:hypothetical protein n=1 Tax=Citrobacter sp. Igbk 17 TaxID=2963957 RepID=UPI0023036AE1|nr:hypothetical protein [Citrobacter sp. Igbk 17]MDA8500283.1 hypothetical protein [Citrobacter sp. Igbk 17]